MEQNGSDLQFRILTSSSQADDKTFVLKHNNTFAVFNRYGDLVPYPKSSLGIFHEGTRFLSGYGLRVDGDKPLFLSSNLRDRNEMFAVDLTNPDIIADRKIKLEKGIIHIIRRKVLWDSVYYENICFRNFGMEEIEFNIDISFDADFSDVFEVRGTERARKGNLLPVSSNSNKILIGYMGTDQTKRTTEISLDPRPDRLEGGNAGYLVRLGPGENFIFSVTISFLISGIERKKVLSFRRALKSYQRRLEYIDQHSCWIETSNDQFNHWLGRSRTDLITMISETPSGPYPYAGIPWYDNPFGRDGIITALECLWMSPEVARGVLQYLAATQARETDHFRDSEPGKIMHEARNGEMANMDEIPFRMYYGTIDATPLFVVLAGAYFLRTGKLELIREIWPNITRALEWIEKYGDVNGDSFVEYQRKKETGLINQGWKDSYDSVFYEDGHIAELPIALCEVQGYVYDAWIKAAVLAEAMGDKVRAGEYRDRALDLREKFSSRFWSESKSTFHLALANKKSCNVLSSNAGHCLFSGIASPVQARKIAGRLLAEEMFTGWGIRTLGSGEPRYNPMSYHNGSIWPHDNAIIAYGLARYGFKEEVKKIASGLFDAALFFEGQRLPELFCGFQRRPGEAPTDYPVACSPQSWSVASVFLIIQALLGMEIHPGENTIRFYRPTLPGFIKTMRIRNLSFGELSLDLEFVRTGENVSISLLNMDQPVKLEITY